MARLRADFPDAYALVEHRRVIDPRLTRLAFSAVEAWELLASAALWLGVLSLGAAALGMTTADVAILRGLVGAGLFSATWMAFLVVGNWYCYWFGHEGAQNTHFQMTLWGIGCTGLMIMGLLLV